jgi:hypothetical protein
MALLPMYANERFPGDEEKRRTAPTGLYAECFIYFIPTFLPCIFIALGG